MLLNVHSYYSLRYGINSIAELADLLVVGGYDTAVLTDINNSSGVLDFISACAAQGIRGLAGLEFRRGSKLLYIGIAKNPEGFRELNAIITTANLSGTAIPFPAPPLRNSFIVYPVDALLPRAMYEHEFTGVAAAELTRLWKQPPAVQERCVILKPVTFRNRAGFDLHRQLRAIDNNTLLSRLSPEQHAGTGEVFCTRARLLERFADFPQLIRNTEALLAACSFDFDFRTPKNRRTFTGCAYEDKLLLQEHALAGLEERYGKDHGEALLRVKKELAVIDACGFNAYFLIAWDIVRYTRSRGFFHIGRGSGANSIVAYCLRITDVCPLALNLYFERFLNASRASPPDFDIDFSWRDRNAVYDYIFEKYGPEHTALLGAMSTFGTKSVIRELGKVYGLPKGEIDAITRDPASVRNRHELAETILSLQGIDDLPNLRTIHAGGVLISELPINCYTALDLPPKGYPTAQIDMHLAEKIGLEKLDILSQRGLGHIRDCAGIIRENTGTSVDVHAIETFMQDERVKTQLSDAKTIGCFYIESPAMRQLLTKLRCDSYPVLTIASSIIRPGVSASGMMKEFIFRHHHPDSFTHLHPVMAQELGETHGVMVFQEDVMRIGMQYGGLSPEEADMLRRLMSGKNRGRHHLVSIRENFFRNTAAKGYPEAVSREVWRQMESFAGYSFCKAHSASYAVESYQSLYLKTYWPLEFMVAVINNFGGFYRTRIYVHEARRSGGVIHLPCVNSSRAETTIAGKDIFLGFQHISSLEERHVFGIPLERDLRGPFADLEDLVRRAGLNLQQTILLIRVGAARFTGKNKKELLWTAHALFAEGRPATAPALFRTGSRTYHLPTLAVHPLEDAYDEIALLGFPVTLRPHDLLQTDFRCDVPARDLLQHVGREIRIVGDFVDAKYVPTRRGDMMNFATFLDAEGDFLDTVHFPPSLKRYPLQGAGLYGIRGRVVEEFGCPALEVSALKKLPIRPDPRGWNCSFLLLPGGLRHDTQAQVLFPVNAGNPSSASAFRDTC